MNMTIHPGSFQGKYAIIYICKLYMFIRKMACSHGKRNYLLVLCKCAASRTFYGQ